MDQRRILFVSHSGAISGAEAVLIELVKPMADASVFVFEAGALKDRLVSLGLSVTTSRWARGLARIKRDGSLLQALPIAGRLMAITAEIARKARQYDLIYANSQKAFVLSAIAARIARRPLVWHLHDIPSREHFGRIQLKLQITLANRCANRVIVPSVAVAEGFIAAGGVSHLLRIVANGVVPPTSENLPKQEIRSELGLPEGPLIGVFSRLAAWKGQHVLIAAMANLLGVHCIVAGTALFGEDAYAAELRALAIRLDVQDRVHFLGHRTDIPILMQAVDIVIHTSISAEPFGLTVIEGALAGTPVIATATGGVPEILEDGKAGWLVPPDDAKALEDAIRSVFSAPFEAGERAAYARARAETRYSAERMVTEIRKVISEIPAVPNT